jgi:ribosome biogenesis protein YTM1
MAVEDCNVQVRFVTKLAKYRVSEAPVEIPTRLTRRGLSSVVNMLLSLDPPQPFDFLVNHSLIRESVAHYMAAHALSTEDVITIEYILLPSSPELSDDTPQDDWVSAVCMRVAGVVASAGFDGSVKLQRGGITLQTKLHTQPVTALAPLVDGEHPTFVSASVDRTLRVHSASEDGLMSPFVCMGHMDSVTSVASNPAGSKFVSASADSLLKIWDNPFTGYRPRSVKRSKTDDALQRTCVLSLDGHTQPVRAVTWRLNDIVYSASEDLTVKEWDCSHGVCKASFGGGRVRRMFVHHTFPFYFYHFQVPTAIDYSPSAALVVTAHTDKLLRLWDPRTSEGQVMKSTLSSHSSWVTCVSWNPGSAYHVLSGSVDKTACVWDVRPHISNHCRLRFIRDRIRRFVLDLLCSRCRSTRTKCLLLTGAATAASSQRAARMGTSAASSGIQMWLRIPQKLMNKKLFDNSSQNLKV